MTETLSIKVSTSEKEQLRRIAELRSVSMSQLLRESLHTVLDSEKDQGGSTAKHEAMKLLEELWKTSSGGPGDLSTNKKYMEGFGKSS